ncbi:MAG: CDP-alcohol phosphatidyltransferase family protein, partial [Candidatus Hydrothermae bacterium]|nr:CDP-alcohol phosphatidyltransferase family protein [Candidatus Hydrothermae bacterium]
PMVSLLAHLGISPNMLTFLGPVLTLPVAYLYLQGHFREAALALIAVGLFDTLDGQLARHLNRTTDFGAFLDSSLDRVAEAMLFGTWMWGCRDRFPGVLWIYLALVGSFMVSYARARGEGLGVSTRVGPMDRALRYGWIIAASLAGSELFLRSMPYFALLVWLTVANRYRDLYNRLSVPIRPPAGKSSQ